MAFDWLTDFFRKSDKPVDYAERTLAAYRMGMNAQGAIRGVRVDVGEDCCDAARALPAGAVYHPDSAPRLPLPGCPHGGRCRCAYRPV